MIEWIRWGASFGASLSGLLTVALFYTHWSMRFTKPRLGAATELGAAACLALVLVSVVALFLEHTP